MVGWFIGLAAIAGWLFRAGRRVERFNTESLAATRPGEQGSNQRNRNTDSCTSQRSRPGNSVKTAKRKATTSATEQRSCHSHAGALELSSRRPKREKRKLAQQNTDLASNQRKRAGTSATRRPKKSATSATECDLASTQRKRAGKSAQKSTRESATSTTDIRSCLRNQRSTLATQLKKEQPKKRRCQLAKECDFDTLSGAHSRLRSRRQIEEGATSTQNTDLAYQPAGAPGNSSRRPTKKRRCQTSTTECRYCR